MFEDDTLKARIAKFFYSLEIQFSNILQMSKLHGGRAFDDERALAAYLVNFLRRTIFTPCSLKF